MSKEVPDCCLPKKSHPEKKGFWWGVLYGLLPHTFCILFVVFAILGATTGTIFLKKFLVVPYFFQILVFVSLIFASISASLYLKRTNNFSLFGIKRKWRYLTILFVTTVSINLCFIYFILPMASQIGNKTSLITPAVVQMSGEIVDGVQIVQMTQTGRGYDPSIVTIKKNMPVKWIMTGTNLGFCSSSLLSRQLNIQQDLKLGENVFEFTPQKTGKIKFSCIMGMYTGYFNVIE